MSDRELLEWAAKAAGYVIDQRASFMTWRDSQKLALLNPRGGHTLWNPLTNDGDALRLFAKMPFCTLYVSEIGVTVNLPRPEGRMLGLKCDEYAEEHGGDMSAAIRRAVVRAAASIGQQKGE